MATTDRAESTIDELASATGTTSRRIRAFQTLGLLPYPELRGRTGVYGTAHHDRVVAILRLQDQGFSLESLGVLFDALTAGHSLATVLGLAEPEMTASPPPESADSAELYGFAELQQRAERRRKGKGKGKGRPLLSIVPTTMWDEGEAS